MPPPMQNNYISFLTAMAPGDVALKTIICNGVLHNDTINNEVLPTLVANSQFITTSEILVVNNGLAVSAKVAIAPGTPSGVYQLLLSIFMTSDSTLVINRNINLTVQSL